MLAPSSSARRASLSSSRRALLRSVGRLRAWVCLSCTCASTCCCDGRAATGAGAEGAVRATPATTFSTSSLMPSASHVTRSSRYFSCAAFDLESSGHFGTPMTPAFLAAFFQNWICSERACTACAAGTFCSSASFPARSPGAQISPLWCMLSHCSAMSFFLRASSKSCVCLLCTTCCTCCSCALRSRTTLPLCCCAVLIILACSFGSCCRRSLRSPTVPFCLAMVLALKFSSFIVGAFFSV
mmetsp:Transcript_26468/g.67283  ORF Transcript_26468/g.67283 Transcript_26468/m.67283 type:complete len:241 (-) Transcript_26468:942-1664(-)